MDKSPIGIIVCNEGTEIAISNPNVTNVRQLLTMFKATALAAGFDWVDAIQIVSKHNSLDEVKVWSSED